MGEGISRIFPQHTVSASRKRLEKPMVQTNAAGSGWTLLHCPASINESSIYCCLFVTIQYQLLVCIEQVI